MGFQVVIPHVFRRQEQIEEEIEDYSAFHRNNEGSVVLPQSEMRRLTNIPVPPEIEIPPLDKNTQPFLFLTKIHIAIAC